MIRPSMPTSLESEVLFENIIQITLREWRGNLQKKKAITFYYDYCSTLNQTGLILFHYFTAYKKHKDSGLREWTTMS